MEPTITVPDSVFIGGEWHAATWLAEVIDDDTGELIITATVTQPTSVVALRMDMDLARRLRAMALPAPSNSSHPSDPSNAPCYDCRTTWERLMELEEAIQADIRERIEDRRRLAALEDAIANLGIETWLSSLESRMEQRMDASIRHSQRLEKLEKLNLATIAYLENRAQGITGPDAGL